MSRSRSADLRCENQILSKPPPPKTQWQQQELLYKDKFDREKIRRTHPSISRERAWPKKIWKQFLQCVDIDGHIPNMPAQIEAMSQSKGQGENPLRTWYRMTWKKFRMIWNQNQKIGKIDPPHQIDPKLDQDARNNSQIWQDKRKKEDPMRNDEEMRKIELALNLGFRGWKVWKPP